MCGQTAVLCFFRIFGIQCTCKHFIVLHMRYYRHVLYSGRIHKVHCIKTIFTITMSV